MGRVPAIVGVGVGVGVGPVLGRCCRVCSRMYGRWGVYISYPRILHN